MEFEERPRDCSPGHAGKEGLHLATTEASRGFSRAGEPVWDFSRGMTGSSGSLSCGAREVKSPCEFRGGTRHCSRVMVGESGFKTREGGFLRSFSGCGGKESFPSTSAGDYRELPMVTLRGEGCCGVGRASRDSAGFGAMEEGLISRGGRNLRLPLGFGLRLHGPCRVGTGESCLVLSEEWNSGCLSSCSRSLRPLVELCVDPAGFSG